MRDSVFAIRSDPVSRRSGPSLATILLPRQWALLDNTESIDSLHLQESGLTRKAMDKMEFYGEDMVERLSVSLVCSLAVLHCSRSASRLACGHTP
mmetsp:Transcript_35433/g.79309  ORF Transcript_35433/g.79309 Transcript_35433/m.79309 type:complete len:95 (-) Transcript_35433:2479-2763(-)